MSFWLPGVTGKAEDAFTGMIEPIPDNERVYSEIKKAVMTDGVNQQIEVEWIVLGGEYNNRHIFQKLRVFDEDKKRAEKAQNMLMLMFRTMGLEVPQIVSMNELRRFNGKRAELVVGVYDIIGTDGKRRVGNYVREIHPKETGVPTVGGSESAMVDDIPF